MRTLHSRHLMTNPPTRQKPSSLTILSDIGLYLKNKYLNLLTTKKIKKIKNNKYQVLINCAIVLSIVLITTFGHLSSSKASTNVELLKLYAHGQLLNATQFHCLDLLWTHESHWNYKAHNKSSTASGIPQILGMKETDPAKQIVIGIKYIQGRYVTPCAALAHWLKVGSY